MITLTPKLIRSAICVACMLTMCLQAHARTKLVALPARAHTTIRLDNPRSTLIEEERVLTLQQGLNKVDFSWNGVSINPDSIRLKVLSHPDKVKLLNVSYPPGENALVWEIYSPEPWEEKVKISYLLWNIDRLITYKLLANKEETEGDMKCFVVLRNFSGEDFDSAEVVLGEGVPMQEKLDHEETKRVQLFNIDPIGIKKVWEFDAAKLPWDPEQHHGNVGIPVRYEIANTKENKLGKGALWNGKVRVFQEDGRSSTIFSGEDKPALVPAGEDMEVYIGDSRDIVVTQRKMQDKKVNVRRNNSNSIIMYDTDEIITAKIENFKDSKATLTMIQHIPGQWEMKECNMPYTRKNAETLEFTIELLPDSTKELNMHYERKNVRPQHHNTYMTRNVR